MKPILKQFVQALFLIFLLFASCYFPGSEKDNIRFMTLAYANGAFFSSTNLPLRVCAFIDTAIPIRLSIVIIKFFIFDLFLLFY